MFKAAEKIQELIDKAKEAQKFDGIYQSTGFHRYRIAALEEALKIVKEEGNG